MSPRIWRERLQDIVEAITEIQAFTAGMSFEAFAADKKTMRAVELDLIVIGEAVNQIPEHIEQENPDIPWSLMRAMRNRLVHVYFAVDARLLWDTIQKDLPNLFSAIQSIR